MRCMSLCCKRFINHTNFIHMKFICILVGTLVLSNLNTDSPPHPFPSLLDSVLLWQENIEMHFQEKTNQADVVCCLQHLQVLEYQIPNLRSIYTCSCASKLRREQGNFYKMCRRCWNWGVIFLVLLLTHLQYGMKWWLL
jgi:hypothetical protein